MSDQIQILKKKYVEYFKEVPIQKYAAMSIGRNEDTIILWKSKDSDFSDAVKMAEAEFIRSKMGKVKPEFALERLFKSAFSQKQEVEVTNDSMIPVAGTMDPDLKARLAQAYKDHVRATRVHQKV